MKRSYLSVAVLCVILMMNIVFTQLIVHQYFFEHYVTVLIYCGFNILLFPIALLVYQQDRKRKGVHHDEQ
ncbi:hypothetical protein [Pseudobacillus wudalianchiensis]|uniref:Uncharacterized protein n=1 Tax=Pseudobacillus wudalianchiensis TaxID=1743143 RepID=A0A1B9AMX1_9BACI|nr:hypothetical protein [Bacillus wudalianchiensis]OCA85135.1 hypothetical protein A8F95_10655 [Bacillus wudalianchiensis]